MMLKQFQLPLWENKNIRIFYFQSVLHNAWFFIGNWIFYWTMFMTYSQLGVLDGVAFAFGLLMEIPTGAIADFFGKRKTIIASTIITCLGMFTFTFGRAYTPMFVGFLITQFGWALYSGSGEAMAYDTLLEKGQESNFDDVISRSHTLRLVTIVISALLGIFMYAWIDYLPQAMWAIFYFVSFIISFGIIEPAVDSYKFSWGGYFKQFSSGFKTMFKKELVIYSLPLVALGAVYTIYDIGLVRPAISAINGINDVGQSIIFSVSSLSAAGLIYFLPKIRKKIEDYTLISILLLVSAVTFFILGFKVGMFLIVPMILLGTVGSSANPLFSIILNKNTKSEERSTTLSTAAFISSLPYALVAIFIGKAIESDKVFYFIAPIALVALLIWIYTLTLGKSA